MTHFACPKREYLPSPPSLSPLHETLVLLCEDAAPCSLACSLLYAVSLGSPNWTLLQEWGPAPSLKWGFLRDHLTLIPQTAAREMSVTSAPLPSL